MIKEKYIKSSPAELQKIYHKSSKDLLNILSKEQFLYSQEIIDEIKKELLKRGTSQNDVEFASEAYFKAVERDKRGEVSFRKKVYRYGMLLFGLTISAMVKTECVDNKNNFSGNVNDDKWSDIRAAMNEEADSLLQDDPVKLSGVRV